MDNILIFEVTIEPEDPKGLKTLPDCDGTTTGDCSKPANPVNCPLDPK